MSLKSSFPAGARDITIETPRLVLREIELTDKKRLLEITNTPGFAHYCFDGSEEKVDTFLKKCLDNRKPNPKTGKRDYIMLAITDKKTGEFIGCASMEHKTFVKGCDYEVNFFVDIKKQSHGYGREAIVNLMDYAFVDMKQPALNVTIEPDNTPSLKTALTQGYKDTGEVVEIDTPCFGTRKFKVLVLDKATYESFRKVSEKLFLPKTAQPAKKNLPPPPKAA